MESRVRLEGVLSQGTGSKCCGKRIKSHLFAAVCRLRHDSRQTGTIGMAESKRSVAELVVQGPAGQSLRQQLVEGQVMRLGRAPASGWAVSWDRTISREHADLCWKNGKLTVTCLPTAANPIRLRDRKSVV